MTAPRPSARSAAERRLDRIHSDADRIDDLESRLDAARRNLVEKEVEIARLIAAHPRVRSSALDVLGWVDHDSDDLLELFEDVYRPQEVA